MGVQFPRQKELLKYYRDRGHYVIAGGSYASLCPERYADLADSVIAGEAEEIFPEFCRDFEAGAPQAPLSRDRHDRRSPIRPCPRFDLLKLDRYHAVTLQFSRGCPFRCEFCDIIVMFGRKPRVKTMDQVGRELDELRRCGVRNVFFVDDNLIGNLPRSPRACSHTLRDYQGEHAVPLQFRHRSVAEPGPATRNCCGCSAPRISAGCSSASNPRSGQPEGNPEDAEPAARTF